MANPTPETLRHYHSHLLISPSGKNQNDSQKRELVFKEDGQEYATVTKMLGNGYVQVQCCDGEVRMAHIRGTFRKKVW